MNAKDLEKRPETVKSEGEKKRKKKKLSAVTLIRFALIAFGLIVLSYPFVSNMVNSYTNTRLVEDYNKVVAETPQEDWDKLLAEARAYNESLASKSSQYNELTGEHDWYESCLNVAGNGMMGYVEIPKLNVQLPIYHGTDDAVLQIAAGHMYLTSLPVGGANTHAVLSGHTGLPTADLFTHLPNLEEGDIFFVHVLNMKLAYEVCDTTVVLPDDTSQTKIREEGSDYCTLSTCTPYGVNSHRLLVRGKHVTVENVDRAYPPYSNEKTLLEWFNDLNPADKAFIYAIALIAVAALTKMALWLRKRKKKRKKAEAKAKAEAQAKAREESRAGKPDSGEQLGEWLDELSDDNDIDIDEPVRRGRDD